MPEQDGSGSVPHFGRSPSSRTNERCLCWPIVCINYNIVDWVAHCGLSGPLGEVMVWGGVCYGQRTQVHFIHGILNAQRYRDEILRPIVVQFIHDHHLMLQGSVHNSWKLKKNSVLAWPAYSPDRSPIEHVWDALDRRLRQCVPVPANIQQLHTAIEEEWTNITQATINNLIVPQSTTWPKEMCCTAWGKWWSHRILTGFRTPPDPSNTVKQHILEWPFIVASLRYTCAIIMLYNQHLDMPHLWGGWIISSKEKCSLTQI